MLVQRTHHVGIVQGVMVQTRRSAQAAHVGAKQQQRTTPSVQEHFEGIRNIRDLAEADPRIAPGKVFRTAAPLKATSQDVRRLYNDLGIKDLVDLRSSEELRFDGTSEAFAGSSFCSYRKDPAVARVVPDPTTYKSGSSDVLHVQIPIMEKQRYYVSLLLRMSKRLAVKLVLLRMIDEPASRKLAIQEVNSGGLEGLYRILLEDSGPWFAAALRHISKSVETNRPVLFFCKAGKDRTGLLAAMILTLMGASEETILADYVRSDEYHQVGLAGLEDNPQATGLDRDTFERAPRKAMHYALRLLEDAGGVEQYLVNAGFGLDEQQQLQQLLARQEPSS